MVTAEMHWLAIACFEWIFMKRHVDGGEVIIPPGLDVVDVVDDDDACCCCCWFAICW